MNVNSIRIAEYTCLTKQLLKSVLIIFLLFFSLLSMNSWADSAPASHTINHAMGTTTIYGKPTRVVSLFQGATDTLVALGVKPVGVVESWTQKPMYDYLRPQLPNVQYIGLETQPSLEDIALLEPDLIIASRFRNEKTYNILSQIAPTVALENVYDFRQTLLTVGAALGREQKANQLLADWDQRLANTRKNLQHKYGVQQYLPTVSLIEFRADHIRAYSPNSFSGAILSDLGFKWPDLVADEQWALKKLVSKEAIPLLDSDMCFYFIRENPATIRSFQSWTRHPLWSQLRVSNTGQMHQVNSVNWNLAGGIISANLVLNDINDRLLHDVKVNSK